MAKKTPKYPELKFKKPALKDPLKDIPKDLVKFVPDHVISTLSKPENLLTLKAWVDLNFILSVRITNQIVEAVIKGAAGRNKTVNTAALQEWAAKLQIHISAVLPKNDWPASEATVLKVAAAMGDFAGQLTGISSTECKASQLKASFLAAKSHADCVASSGVGGGNWCSFDWF